jgi:hypothetical protein
LVHRDVDNDRAGLHVFQILATHQAWRASTSDEDGTDDEIGLAELRYDRMAIAEERRNVLRQYVVEVPESLEIRIEDAHRCSESRRDACRLRSHDATAQDRDVRRLHTGNAAEQDPASFLGPLEVLRSLLNAHSAGDFTHGRQETQVAPEIL